MAEPELGGAGEALVRPLAVALCDLDHLIVQGQAPIPGEIALGHEQVGEVVAVGDEVARPPAWATSWWCRSRSAAERATSAARGRTGDCEAVPPQSMYGFGMVGGDWGGALSDLVRVPFADAMLVPLPEGVEPVSVASAGDNVVDGWRTVSGPARAGVPARRCWWWAAWRARWASTRSTRRSRWAPSRSPTLDADRAGSRWPRTSARRSWRERRPGGSGRSR